MDARIADAAAGAGGVVSVEGSAGLGKTRLLGVVAERTLARGLRVLTARGGEQETEFAFGVVRQLFDRLLHDADEARRGVLLSGAARFSRPLLTPAGGAGPDWADRDVAGATLHGLHWLVANLADEGALVLIVDDVQWADRASVAWLSYLAPRLADLPVLLALGVRTGEPNSTWPDAGLNGIDVQRHRLQPLGPAAAAVVVRRALGSSASDEKCVQCHEATGGNPFLLHELALTLAADAAADAQVPDVTPQRVSLFALARLASAGAAARALAQAVAVLGDGATLHRATLLAELDDTVAGDAADRLIRTDILSSSPLGFVHPLLRSAVYADIAPIRRARLHGRAARLLDSAGADTAATASHLLRSEPAADDDTVRLLRRAAAAAVAAGAPQVATAYLRRCMAEPPTPEGRGEVMRELAFAEDLAGEPAALDDLRTALELSAAGDRASTALRLGEALINVGRTEQAYSVLSDAIAHDVAGDDELAVRLEVWRANIGMWDPRYTDAARSRADELIRFAGTDHPSARLARLLLAYAAGMSGTLDRSVADLIDLGLDGGGLIADEGAAGWPMACAASVLYWLDDVPRLERLVSDMRADAARRGSAVALIGASAAAAYVALARGDIDQLAAEARTVIALTSEHPLPFWEHVARGFLCEAEMERGDLHAAEGAFSGVDAELTRGTASGGLMLFSRSRLDAAKGDSASAIAALRECGALSELFGYANPWRPWRSDLARHLVATDPQEALALAAEALTTARSTGVPRDIGIALHALARVQRSTSAPDLLREAIDHLSRSHARLDHARALVDLGATLRRAGRRADARGPLAEGRELAHACGAGALAERARQELLAAGARPRRLERTGIASLTPSERRIVELAATGAANRAIAEQLFVSTRTVESHLQNAYRKLGASSREQLTALLRTVGVDEPKSR